MKFQSQGYLGPLNANVDSIENLTDEVTGRPKNSDNLGVWTRGAGRNSFNL